MELKERIEQARRYDSVIQSSAWLPNGRVFLFTESELKQILEMLIINYNEWLLEHGYTDFDIISEFELDDYFNSLNLF